MVSYHLLRVIQPIAHHTSVPDLTTPSCSSNHVNISSLNASARDSPASPWYEPSSDGAGGGNESVGAGVALLSKDGSI